MSLLVHKTASFLYCPTMLGATCRRTRWHHSIHLIPGRLFERICQWTGAVQP